MYSRAKVMYIVQYCIVNVGRGVGVQLLVLPTQAGFTVRHYQNISRAFPFLCLPSRVNEFKKTGARSALACSAAKSN